MKTKELHLYSDDVIELVEKMKDELEINVFLFLIKGLYDSGPWLFVDFSAQK